MPCGTPAAPRAPAQYPVPGPRRLRDRPPGAPSRPRDGPPRRRLIAIGGVARSGPAEYPRAPWSASASKTASRSSPPTARRSASSRGSRAATAVNQSLAEATVPPGGETVEHFHRTSEEIYYFTAGAGRMRLGDGGGRRARGRHRRDRAGHARTSSSTPARSRSSCSAAARPRTPTRTPSCCEASSWPLLLAAAGRSRRPPRAAAPLIGIGEQHPQIFTDAAFAPLGIRDVRFIASYDALELRLAARRARRLPARPRATPTSACCSSFGHSRNPQQAAHGCRRSKRVRARVRRASARATRGCRDYLTWNEANHCSQPTCNNPKRAAAVLPRAAQALHGLPDRRRRRARRLASSAQWVEGASRRRSASAALIWGLHNYIDANRFRTRGTQGAAEGGQGRHLVHRDRRDRQAHATTRRSSFPASTAPRREGDDLRLQARRALDARQARVLLPLVPGTDARRRPGTPRSSTRTTIPVPPTRCSTHGCVKHGIAR